MPDSTLPASRHQPAVRARAARRLKRMDSGGAYMEGKPIPDVYPEFPGCSLPFAECMMILPGAVLGVNEKEVDIKSKS